MMVHRVSIHSDGWHSADKEERNAERERIREMSRGTRLERSQQGYNEVARREATFLAIKAERCI